MSRRHRPLHLPVPPAPEPPPRRSHGRRRRGSLWQGRLRQAAAGVAMAALGAGILVGLVQLTQRLDALLLVSTAIASLIAGLGRLSLALLQLGGLLLVVLLVLLALLLLLGGAVRLVRSLLPRPVRRRLPSGAAAP